MQVILDSLFARPGSAPIGGGKKGEFRDWTTMSSATVDVWLSVVRRGTFPASPSFGGLCVSESFSPVCLLVRFSADVLPFRVGLTALLVPFRDCASLSSLVEASRRLSSNMAVRD